MVPGGWGAVKDDGGCLFYFNFSHNPHRVQYEPPELEEDGGGLAWREILSLSEATRLAASLSDATTHSTLVVEAGGFQQDNNNQNQLIRFLFPSKLTDTECHNLYGCDHQGLSKVRDSYVIPFLATPGPGGGEMLNISLKGY